MNPIPRRGDLHPFWMSRFQRWRSRRHPSRGQALVEMALVSVVLLLLLATVIDFGRLFYAQVSSENTARAGVIVASRAPSSYTGACSVLAASTWAAVFVQYLALVLVIAVSIWIIARGIVIEAPAAIVEFINAWTARLVRRPAAA